MLENPIVQSGVTILLYALRILAPVFSLLVVIKCFLSQRAGRRSEEPVMLLENVVTHQKIPVLYWENSLGRSKSCDILLDDMTASRDHAVLMRRESGWLVTDTNSKSGTRVNGRKIKGRTQVIPGDTISMGSTSLMLKRTTEKAASVKTGRRRVPRAAAPAGLLWMTTLTQLFLCVQAFFAREEFSLLPLLPFAALVAMEWGLYIFSRKVLNRVSFELETIGFLLSGTGILLLAGVDVSNTVTQLVTMLAGIVLFCLLIWFMGDLDRVMKWRIAIAIFAVLLFAATLVLGREVYGSKNWIYLGPISIQPSELIKIAFIFVGASTLDHLQTTRNLTGFIGFGVVCMGFLFLQRDFGTACIFFVTFLIISFMRSGSFRTLALSVSAALLGAFLILKFKPYVADRFAGWRHVWEFVNENQGYQQTRVLTYSASGGFFGVGLGEGALKDVFAATSDLVSGMIMEELGLLLFLVVLAAIGLLIFYARSDVTRSRSTFYSIAACAAAGLLLFQGCLNVFGVTDVLPLTGVTLPFVSAGGSSMMACWGLLAFIKASDERTYAARRRKT